MISGRIVTGAPAPSIGAAPPPAAPPPAAAPPPPAAAAPVAPPAEPAAPPTPPAPAPEGGAMAAAVAAVAAKVTEGEPPKVEAKPAAEPPKEPPRESPDAWRFAALQAKEKAIRERQDAAKAKEAEVAKREEALRAEDAKRAARRDAYRSNPLAALEDAGINYEDLTQFVLNNRSLTPEQKTRALAENQQRLAQDTEAKLKAQADDFARQLKERDESMAKAQADAVEQAKVAFLEEIKGVASAEAEKYEMIGIAGAPAVQAAFELIDKTYQETGRQMPTTAALEQVEAQLLAAAAKEVRASKKLAALFAPPPPPPPAPPPPPPPPAPKTLNNKMTAAAPGATRVTLAHGDAEKQRRDKVKAEIERAWGR